MTLCISIWSARFHLCRGNLIFSDSYEGAKILKFRKGNFWDYPLNCVGSKVDSLLIFFYLQYGTYKCTSLLELCSLSRWTPIPSLYGTCTGTGIVIKFWQNRTIRFVQGRLFCSSILDYWWPESYGTYVHIRTFLIIETRLSGRFFLYLLLVWYKEWINDIN